MSYFLSRPSAAELIKEAEAMDRLRRVARKHRQRQFVQKWFWPAWSFVAGIVLVAMWRMCFG